MTPQDSARAILAPLLGLTDRRVQAEQRTRVVRLLRRRLAESPPEAGDPVAGFAPEHSLGAHVHGGQGVDLKQEQLGVNRSGGWIRKAQDVGDRCVPGDWRFRQRPQGANQLTHGARRSFPSRLAPPLGSAGSGSR